MIGRVEKIDKDSNYGYIKGLDENYYFFRDIKDLKVGDLIEFDYTLSTVEDGLFNAINIKKAE